MEKSSIGMATLPEAALAHLAQTQGFFREEGLDMTASLYPYGKVALRQLLDGKVEFATVAETPVMFAILNGEKISVVATIVTSKSGHAIVARRDRGITSMRDLRGKTLATTHGTSGQFYLDAMLITNGISQHEVKVLDLPAEKLPAALARGEVDAISTFSPYTVLAEKESGKSAVTFVDPDIYTYTFHVVARQDVIAQHPEKVRKVLRALIRAESYVRSDPEDAQQVMARITGVQADVVRKVWQDAQFQVSLDQTLVLALEDEADWAIKSGLTKAKSVPNYLPFIYLEGLQSVRPRSVRILK